MLSPFAIVVGVGKYPKETASKGTTLKDLPTCEVAARNVFELFTKAFPELIANNRILVFCSNSDGFPDGVSVAEPTESNIKEIFEDKLAAIGEADPLILYWSGHGAALGAGLGQRRLLLQDSSTSNLRNLSFDSLEKRITSKASRIRSLVMVVDACALFDDERLWPQGQIVGAAARPREEGFLTKVCLFSTTPGDAALGGRDNAPPYYTELLLKEITSLSATTTPFQIIELFYSAHNAVRARLKEEVTELAQIWNKSPEQLAHQLPFEFFERTPNGDHREPLDIGIGITPNNAIPIANSWAHAFIAFEHDTNFASTAAQRNRLAAYKSEIIQFSEGLRDWWTIGERNDRAIGRRRKRALQAITLLTVALVFVVLFVPGYWLADGLAREDKVSEYLESHFAPVRWASKLFLSGSASAQESRLDLDERNAAARRRANAAMALLIMGSDKEFRSLMGGNGSEWYDPQARTYAILRAVVPAGIGQPKLLDLLHDKTLSDREVQAVVLSLGQIKLGEGEQLGTNKYPTKAVAQRLLRIFEEHPDPGVHAAALWCLREKFRDEETQAELRSVTKRLRDAESPRELTSDYRWFIDKGTGLTMIVLIAEGKTLYYGNRDETRPENRYFPGSCLMQRSFLVSMTEVAQVNLIRGSAAETPDGHALNNLTKKDAEQRCKQLDELSPPNQTITIAGKQYRILQHRLPDEVEWEYACRAGSQAAFCFGDDLANRQILSRYATLIRGSSAPPVLLRKMPNDFGLFDVHGGVAEWCANDFVPFPPDQDQLDLGSTEGVIRGGSGYQTNDYEELAAYRREIRNKRVRPAEGLVREELGFRVVRTIVALQSRDGLENGNSR